MESDNISTDVTTAYMGLGSNLGDSRAMIDQALEAVNDLNGVDVVCVSDIIETAPLGGPDGQGQYLNAAAGLSCRLSPVDLLAKLLVIEQRLGRIRAEKNGPRCIDLDLLLFGNAVIDQPGLIVPHPRMHTRSFVLVPMAQIAGDVVHPVLNKTMAKLLSDLEKIIDG